MDIGHFPLNEKNPFMSNLLVPKKKKTQFIGIMDDLNESSKVIVDTETAEIEPIVIGMTVEVDKQEFVKIYTGQLGMLFDLSKTALKVLSFIWEAQEFGDVIILNIESCLKFTGFKHKNSVNWGLTELMEAEIIAKGPVANVYYTNPAIFYKGDRLVLIKEYRRKHTPLSKLKKINK
jgi:hypothetical protein